jgi:hypothetical protein
MTRCPQTIDTPIGRLAISERPVSVRRARIYNVRDGRRADVLVVSANVRFAPMYAIRGVTAVPETGCSFSLRDRPDPNGPRSFQSRSGLFIAIGGLAHPKIHSHLPIHVHGRGKMRSRLQFPPVTLGFEELSKAHFTMC